MVYIKWFAIFCLYVLMLPTLIIAPFIIALIYKEQEYRDDGSYTWGWIWGAYDNPPQGDRKWLKDHPELTGWRGYLNRVGWMRRNRLYGLKRWLAVDYTECTTRKFRGNPSISDKYKVPGWLFVTARCNSKKLRAFEGYSVTPYTKNRCLRMRIGWKIKGDKFDEVGEFGALVFTINPFDTYGDD